MKYQVISGATEGSPYVAHLKQQERDIPNYRGYIVKDRGSWEENTKLKPAIIRRALKEYGCVLWIDADCWVDPPEELPPGRWDVGYIKNIHPKHKNKISAGFLLFRDSEPTQWFLDKWRLQNKQHNKDHPALMRVLHREKQARCHDVSNWLKGRHTINYYSPTRGLYEG